MARVAAAAAQSFFFLSFLIFLNKNQDISCRALQFFSPTLSYCLLHGTSVRPYVRTYLRRIRWLVGSLACLLTVLTFPPRLTPTVRTYQSELDIKGKDRLFVRSFVLLLLLSFSFQASCFVVLQFRLFMTAAAAAVQS